MTGSELLQLGVLKPSAAGVETVTELPPHISEEEDELEATDSAFQDQTPCQPEPQSKQTPKLSTLQAETPPSAPPASKAN